MGWGLLGHLESEQLSHFLCLKAYSPSASSALFWGGKMGHQANVRRGVRRQDHLGHLVSQLLSLTLPFLFPTASQSSSHLCQLLFLDLPLLQKAGCVRGGGLPFWQRRRKRKNKVSSGNGESSTVPVAGFQRAKGRRVAFSEGREMGRG